MSLLSCNCLNVQIPVDKDVLLEPISPTQLPPRDYNALHSLVSEKENHIFSSELIPLEVNANKTIIRVDSLVRVQKLGTWVIVRCLNCHTDCYVFDKSQHSSSLYASDKLTHNPDLIRDLNESEELSPAFGIVIRSHLQTRIVNDSDVEAIGVLKQRVTSFISQAKHDSEEKVKELNEKELRRISALERRAWNDFKHLISNIENELTDVRPFSLSPPHSSSHQFLNVASKHFLNDDDDFPFEFDEDTQIDLIVNSSDDNYEDSDSRSETSSTENLAHISRSVPINFPQSCLHARASDDKMEHIKLDDIHSSMKILAQSATHPHYRDLPLPGHYQRSANHI